MILDAGSTGSRVLAYEFHKGYLDGRLVLDKELFKEIKPGVSAYADNPEDGAQKLTVLLDSAKNVIPQNYWSTTPIVLKATAGLRLLGPIQAESILNAIRKVLRESGFLVDKDSVEIMDGTDEGIFSWFTINFLLGRLAKGNTIAALDLGGGSTQVTFSPNNPSETPSYSEFMHTVPTSNSQVDVFTHSYLNLGLMAVRHAVFTNGYQANQTNVQSVCVNSIVKNKLWKYANVEYSVTGKENKKVSLENPEVDYEACLTLIKKKILPLVKPKPITLKQHQIAAFSYYYERAEETGLIYHGGDITIADYYKKAKEVCATPNTDQPFMCLDVSFISVLLESGFDLKPTTQIKLYKHVKGHEISWALGCAFNILTKQLKK